MLHPPSMLWRFTSARLRGEVDRAKRGPVTYYSKAPPLRAGRPRLVSMSPERLSILYVSQMPASPPRFGARARVDGLMTRLSRRHDLTAEMLVNNEFEPGMPPGHAGLIAARWRWSPTPTFGKASPSDCCSSSPGLDPEPRAAGGRGARRCGGP